VTVLNAIGAIAATALASGSVAALVTHFLTNDRERRSLLRQKAEDLYVSVEALETSWSIEVVSLKSVVDGVINYNQYLDLIIERGKKDDGNLNRRVDMLTEIYFPSAVSDLNAVRDALSKYNRLVSVHKEAYRAGQADGFSWHQDFAPNVGAVSAAFANYKRVVVRCAQSSFTPLRVRT